MKYGQDFTRQIRRELNARIAQCIVNIAEGRDVKENKEEIDDLKNQLKNL